MVHKSKGATDRTHSHANLDHRKHYGMTANEHQGIGRLVEAPVEDAQGQVIGVMDGGVLLVVMKVRMQTTALLLVPCGKRNPNIKKCGKRDGANGMKGVLDHHRRQEEGRRVPWWHPALRRHRDVRVRREQTL